MARTMLPDIREFFLFKEGQEEFAAWKAEYEKNNMLFIGGSDRFRSCGLRQKGKKAAL